MVTFDTVREQLLYEVHDPAALPQPRRDRRLHLGHARRPGRRPGAGRAAPAARPPPDDLQGPGVHAGGLGGRGAARRTRGPTPRPRRGPRSRFVRAPGRGERRRRSRSGARSTSASTPSAGRRSVRHAIDRRADAARGDRPAGLAHRRRRVGPRVGARGRRARPVRSPDDRGHRPRPRRPAHPAPGRRRPSRSTARWSTPRSASTFRPSRTVRPPWARAGRVVWWCGCGRRGR